MSEGTSISLLESQACGIPAVVTNVGGNSKIIVHSLNGFLCSVNDDQEMAEYMKLLIKQPDLARQMGVEARQRIVRDFSIGSMTEKYLRIYLEATGKVLQI